MPFRSLIRLTIKIGLDYGLRLDINMLRMAEQMGDLASGGNAPN